MPLGNIELDVQNESMSNDIYIYIYNTIAEFLYLSKYATIVTRCRDIALNEYIFELYN